MTTVSSHQDAENPGNNRRIPALSRDYTGELRPSEPIPQADARRLLLAAIAGLGREPASSFLELRFRRPGEPMRQAFHECRDAAQVSARAAVLAQQHDTYAACAPRTRRFGGADAVERVWMLWADLDGADALDVGVPAPLGATVGVGDAVAEAGALAADVAGGSHGVSPRESRSGPVAGPCERRTRV